MLKMFPVSKSDQSSHFPEDAKATAYNSHNSNKSSRIENGNRVSDDQSMRKPSLTNQNRLLQAQLINEEGVISWEDDKERQLTDLSVAETSRRAWYIRFHSPEASQSHYTGRRVRTPFIPLPAAL